MLFLVYFPCLLYFNQFLYVIILFCFSEPCYIKVEIQAFHTKKDSLYSDQESYTSTHDDICRLFLLTVFCFWILADVRLGASNFVLVSLPLLVPAWISAVCPRHPFCPRPLSVLFSPQSLVFILLILCTHSSYIICFCHGISYRPN